MSKLNVAIIQQTCSDDKQQNFAASIDAIKEAANRLIGDFVRQDKFVGGICHGVSVLAWARVDGRSPLAGKRAVAPQRSGPAGVWAC